MKSRLKKITPLVVALASLAFISGKLFAYNPYWQYNPEQQNVMADSYFSKWVTFNGGGLGFWDGDSTGDNIVVSPGTAGWCDSKFSYNWSNNSQTERRVEAAAGYHLTWE